MNASVTIPLACLVSLQGVPVGTGRIGTHREHEFQQGQAAFIRRWRWCTGPNSVRQNRVPSKIRIRIAANENLQRKPPRDARDESLDFTDGLQKDRKPAARLGEVKGEDEEVIDKYYDIITITLLLH